MKIEVDNFTKTVAGIFGVIGSIYFAWQVFEKYNTNTLETAQVVKDSVITDRAIVTAIYDSRVEVAEQRAQDSSRARLYYQDKVREGSATEADKRRLEYFEGAISKQEEKVERLNEKLESLDSLMKE